MWKKKIGCSPHAKLSVTVQFTIYLWWRARRTYMHACMIARSLVSAITQRSWVDALCSFPCVHYIFRPLRLQGYSCDGWLFSLIAIFPRQSSSPRITTPTKLSPLQRVARELRSLEIERLLHRLFFTHGNSMFTDRNGIFFSSSSFYGSIAYKAKIVNNFDKF